MSTRGSGGTCGRMTSVSKRYMVSVRSSLRMEVPIGARPQLTFQGIGGTYLEPNAGPLPRNGEPLSSQSTKGLGFTGH